MEYYQNYQDDTRNAAGAKNGQEIGGTAGIPGRDDDRKLFVGGLSRQTNDRELKGYFSQFGKIESITVKVHPITGLSRGYAFIVFLDAKSIDNILASGDHFINKRKVDPKRVCKNNSPTQQYKIFVGALVPEITDTDIRDYFSQYGAVIEVQTPFDKIQNHRKGYSFVTFESKEVVYELLKLPKQYINGKEVVVKSVKINPEPMVMSGGRGGGLGRVGRGRVLTIPCGLGCRFGSYYPQGYGGRGYAAGAGYGNFQYGGPYGNYGLGGLGYNSAGAYGGGANPIGALRQFPRHQPY